MMYQYPVYSMSHKFGAIGELGYMEKYKEGKVVANYVFPISSV
jgi:hypothetical protein